MLNLSLTDLPASMVRGIYEVAGQKNQMSARARQLHPAAAKSYLGNLSQVITISDMLRSPESSLKAVIDGRGAMPPAYSAHNYGMAIDVDLAQSMRTTGCHTKVAFDEWMDARGWYCHRRDHLMESEAWHYNYLQLTTMLTNKVLVISPNVRSTAGYVEAQIVLVYGTYLKPSDAECQVLLQKLRMYGGKIDGLAGPMTATAATVFQRAWGLTATGKLDDRTRRTLAFVGCERTVGG